MTSHRRKQKQAMKPKRIFIVDEELRVPRNVAIRYEASIASANLQPAKKITPPMTPRLSLRP
jgi:hypothetical protein